MESLLKQRLLGSHPRVPVSVGLRICICVSEDHTLRTSALGREEEEAQSRCQTET